MTDIQTQPRALAPRKLEQQETLQTLNQWQTVFRNYFRRCQFYGFFLQPGVTWTSGLNRGFTANETTGLKRTPAVLAADLDGLLECLGSYLPFDYVAEKLKMETTDMKSAWAIIYEIYDAEIDTAHYLDYALMKKLPEETYRSFFNRLVGFVRQHLPDRQTQAEGITSPIGGEQLTIGLLDSITVHWLLSIDKRLIHIIKTEFATELKAKRLCQMVKQIAVNIDELLQRYSNSDVVNSIATTSTHQAVRSLTNTNDETIDMIIGRLERLERNKKSSSNFQSSKRNKNFIPVKSVCRHCSFINGQLRTNLNTNHSSQSCTRKKISVSVIESMDHDLTSDELVQDDAVSDEGDLHSEEIHSINFMFQNSPNLPANREAAFKTINTARYVNNKKENDKCVTADDFSDCYNESLIPNPPLKSLPEACTTSLITGTHDDLSNSDTDDFFASLRKLNSSTYKWTAVQKSKSPRMKCMLNDSSVITLIDSGAEINVVDASIMTKAGLGIVKTKEIAKAANQLPLDIRGQSAGPVTLVCETSKGFKHIYLGLVLVVNSLGVDCLIGEPGKANNNIICLPRKKQIILAGDDDVHVLPYYTELPQHTIARAVNTTQLPPGEQIHYKLPDIFASTSHVVVTPRSAALPWLKPQLLEVHEGHVYLTNSSDNMVTVKKTEHIADIRDTSLYLVQQSKPSTTLEQSDCFQYQDLSTGRNDSAEYLDQIKVDPDDVLPVNQKQEFHDLHNKYSHVFTPQPGKYNGHAGYIENKLQFSSPPAPNSRTHVPNYSPSMNQLLAKKMDLLEEWGILVPPEKVNVAVEFVSPSMLVPKADSNDFRLVTDFAALNIYIKRVPNTSATIAQAKSRIARANYVVHLDLANYFYQCGLQKQDIRFLGTVHPFKGLRVYTCDPQGLKGASERSYEKLLRIFGDMIQDGKLAQMADGLHVLGSSVDELILNYEEVLQRASLCNLTFKPSKVTVCPVNINIFGWDLRGQQWFPTSHTISALTNAQIPTTVKELRSCLGSFKQLSSSLPNYAVVIHALEQVVAGRKSGEKLVWTDALQQSFNDAKQLAANPTGIAEPRPDDHLQTFSDYSAETRAVGGRLVILRTKPNGEQIELVGGFYSVILDSHKKNWLPCEGEAAGIRLVLEHFKHHIRESQHTTTHFTDSQPCVLAWKRSQKGAFSASSRISTFLTGLSVLPVELRHRPGKFMYTSDYASRNPPTCTSQKCQICKFAKDWENMGDKASEIRMLSIEDVKAGRALMPLVQRNTWKNMQKRDPIHKKIVELIATQQLPESKKTKGIHTKIKLLHNLYTQGKLYIDNTGLILVRTPQGKIDGSVISIPPTLFPGLVSALHVRLDHPSRTQLANLIARYFYTPGWRTTVEEICDNCHQCASLRKLPKVLLNDTTATTDGIASNFAADVIERHSQKILIVRENLSQYTRGVIIQDQTSQTLQAALLSLILDLIPDSGTTVRVDGATAFQAIQKEANVAGTILNKYKIKIEIGRLLNKNKNPTAENAIQEVQKEILRLTKRTGPISPTELLLVLNNINSRIRYNGFTPKEILFRRDTLQNKPMDIHEEDITQQQMKQRHESAKSNEKFKSKSHSKTPKFLFKIGDLVFLRSGKDKNTPRELYIIEDKDEKHFLIRKMNNRLRDRLYRALPDELILAPDSHDNNSAITPAGRPLRHAARKAHGLLTLNQLPARKKILHGWISDDQESDVEDTYVSYSSHSPCSSTNPSSCNSETSEDLNTASEDELSWDLSPEQFELDHSQEDIEMQAALEPRQLFPEDNVIPFPDNHPNPPSNTLRRFAVSDNQVMRSNAFRLPPDANRIPPPFPRSVSCDNLTTAPIPPPRIPQPDSHSTVNLHAVNDVSKILPIQHTDDTEPGHCELPTPPRPRRGMKTINYKEYHRTGKKREEPKR